MNRMMKTLAVAAAMGVCTLASAQHGTANKTAGAGYDFESDSAGKPPAGFTSYASGGGPAGKWLVKEAPDAPSGKHVVEQTDADPTDNRFPILIADKPEYSDLDVSVKGALQLKHPENQCS